MAKLQIDVSGAAFVYLDWILHRCGVSDTQGCEFQYDAEATHKIVIQNGQCIVVNITPFVDVPHGSLGVLDGYALGAIDPYELGII